MRHQSRPRELDRLDFFEELLEDEEPLEDLLVDPLEDLEELFLEELLLSLLTRLLESSLLESDRDLFTRLVDRLLSLLSLFKERVCEELLLFLDDDLLLSFLPLGLYTLRVLLFLSILL